MSTIQHDIRQLVLLSFSFRFCTTFLLRLSTLFLPLFDRSPDLVLSPSSFLHPFVRWDVLWFLPIAQNGYTFEQQTAFGWGWIWAIKLGAKAISSITGNTAEDVLVQDLILAGVGLSWMAGIGAMVVLYLLTIRLTSSRRFAYLTSTLYILSPSPGASLSPYTEPLYALLTFSGMLLLPDASSLFSLSSTAKLMGAICCWAGATAVRPLGVLNVGYLGWALVIRPSFIDEAFGWRKRIGCGLLAIVAAGSITAPFVGSQIVFYKQFCTGWKEGGEHKWCGKSIPLVYTFVQHRYWNSGFLLYFTVVQLPNFVLSAPIFLVLLWTHLSTLPSYLPFQRASILPSPVPFLTTPSIFPYLIHSVVWSAILFFSSHVQIALRLAQTNPVFWWGAAALVSQREGPRMTIAGRMYLGWLIVWIPVGLVLWAGFYPPA